MCSEVCPLHSSESETLLPGHEPADHFRRTWLVVFLGDRGQIRKITIKTGRPMPKRANTLGNLIDRGGQLRVMRFEQYV